MLDPETGLEVSEDQLLALYGQSQARLARTRMELTIVNQKLAACLAENDQCVSENTDLKLRLGLKTDFQPDQQ